MSPNQISALGFVRVDPETFLIADASDSRSGTHRWFHVSSEPTVISSSQVSLPVGNDRGLVVMQFA